MTIPADRLRQTIADGHCVILDGATGTELIKVSGRQPEDDDHLWGLTALLDSPEEVARVHRSYVDVGCDVISTSTWGLPTALRDGGARLDEIAGPVHWMDLARRAVQLARQAATEAGRGDEVAVAFSLNGDIDGGGREQISETIRLLGRALRDAAPDMILLETLSLVHDSTYATVQSLLETGIPVWLSFRRCRHGVCGVYGEHWGGPEGDAFGRAARRFEEMGVEALAINCIPPDHVAGMLSWLRDFTDLPLGVYPNLGYLSEGGWRQQPGVAGGEYAELALSWRAEGAQIVGGCCGVRPEHLQAAREVLTDTLPGHERPAPPPGETPRARHSAPPLADARGQAMFPLDLPELIVDPGVYVPDQASMLTWKYLRREAIGAHQRCLDIGSGTGLLTVALARNGAAHVHAIDVDAHAVENTLANAFRNGVADRVTGATQDLYPWVPEERYDVIVASLHQTPADPAAQAISHRPIDYWGRNMLDHLLGLLPEALADDGTAYLVQLSIIGQRRTAELLQSAGLEARVVDFSFLEADDPGSSMRRQMARVEAHSDAYHLSFGDTDVLVAYLLEITRKR
jgi:S-methylmethionine-dependent homocysteine/selenocysteine methylase/SAM-dependent methyltransferase